MHPNLVPRAFPSKMALGTRLDAPFLLEGRCALLIFYLPFLIIAFQVQNVQLYLVLELPNTERRISKATKAVGGLGGPDFCLRLKFLH